MQKKHTAGLMAIAATLFLAGILSAQTTPTSDTWQFTVSGDSRNCGDVVMPDNRRGCDASSCRVLLAPRRSSRDVYI